MGRRWCGLVLGFATGCVFKFYGTAETSATEGSSGPQGSSGTSADATTGDPESTRGTGGESGDVTSSSASGTTGSDTDGTEGGTQGTTQGAGTGSDASGSGTTGPDGECHPIIAEVLLSISGADDGREWATLYNPCPDAIDLGAYSLGWGQTSLEGSNDLVGTIAAGGCFVVGGPGSDPGNFDPVYDQVAQFAPQLWITQGGLCIYEADAATVDITTIPVDALVWGDSNVAGWLDPTGQLAAVDLAPPAPDISILRTSLATWAPNDPPTPNACPAI